MKEPVTSIYEFGEFRLDAARGEFLSNDVPIAIKPKAFDILHVLVENAGRVVTKEEIFDRVWPDSFVEETNLSHHIFNLRKALGESEENKFIVTVPKRGYRFVCDVRTISGGETRDVASAPFPAGPAAQPRGRTGFVIALGVLAVMLVLSVFAWMRFRNDTPVTAAPVASPTRERMTIERITNSGVNGGAAISADGKYISYARNGETGGGTLFVKHTSSNVETQLLEPAQRVFGIKAFSPDGAYIYYISYEKDLTQGGLFRIPIFGGEPVKLFENLRAFFSLSPDGRQAAFFRSEQGAGGAGLMIADLDGSGREKKLTVDTGQDFQFTNVLAWSPDGTKLAVAASVDKKVVSDESVQGLYSLDIASGRMVLLTNEKWREIGAMVWTPDSGSLLFVGSRPRTGSQIYKLLVPSGEVTRITNDLHNYGNYGMGITADGSTIVADIWEGSAQIWLQDANARTEARQLTNGMVDGVFGVTAMPDGQIIYAAPSGFNYDLWSLREKDGAVEGRPLILDDATEIHPFASPDGSFIVFSGDRAGSRHIFRIAADGTNLRQLTEGDSVDELPTVSSDSKWVFYQSGTSEGIRIRKVPSEGGEPVTVNDFESLAPAVSPDGKFLACIEPNVRLVTIGKLTIISAEDGQRVKSFDIIPHEYYYRTPSWSRDGRFIVFRTIQNGVGNLWKQSLAGGAPQRITNFNSQLIYTFSPTADGKNFILSRGRNTVNVVSLKNFR